jgi:hypothetical protein
VLVADEIGELHLVLLLRMERRRGERERERRRKGVLHEHWAPPWMMHFARKSP